MGISIHFELQAKSQNPEKAKRIVERLRQRALDLAFERVSELIDLSGPECNPTRYDPDENLYDLTNRAIRIVQDRHILPSRIIAFSALPGLGCDAFHLGLAIYPDVRGRMVRTGIKGWNWSTDCETHYASQEEWGGIHNFLRCHRTVAAILDYADTLGVLKSVCDLGGYWETRDAEHLAGSIEAWERKIDSMIDELEGMRP